MNNKLEKHHIVFTRRTWEDDEYRRMIRRDSGLIVPLEHDNHTELHQNVPRVQPISTEMAQRVIAEFDSRERGTYIENIDSLLLSIEEAMKYPNTKKQEKALAESAMHALELQKPYIDPNLQNKNPLR